MSNKPTQAFRVRFIHAEQGHKLCDIFINDADTMEEARESARAKFLGEFPHMAEKYQIGQITGVAKAKHVRVV